MATRNSEAAAEAGAVVGPEAAARVRPKKSESLLDRGLAVLSSVRFGVIMLSILLICCIIGMLVMQVEVDGFQQYYEKLTPAQRKIYGTLGFFNIYHSWYFNLLLAITGLNIVLASIDRFPTAWQYIAKPRVNASPNFVRAQAFNAEVESRRSPAELAEAIKSDWHRRGFGGRIAGDGSRISVFGQKNTWNRLGAYIVHVGLLTIFIGGFLTSRYGVGGLMEIRPGKSSSTFNTFEMSLEGQKVAQATLPFSVECTDLQQKLIRPEGGLEASNTIDWLSYIRIKDGDEMIDAVVHLNNPVDHRGYRFFQSQFTPIGNAREISIVFESEKGGPARSVRLERDGSTEVEGIGQVTYVGFFPDFDISEQGPGTRTGDYNNPVAQLEIRTPEGRRQTAFAFNPALGEVYYSQAQRAAADGGENPLLVNGNKVLLSDFEKVALAHTLTVQYDPGRLPFYYGSTILVLAMMGVFLFSHQRVWAVLEPDGKGSKVYVGGNTNRNKAAFEGRFNAVVESVKQMEERDE